MTLVPLALFLGSAAALRLDIPAGPGSLEKAQTLVRAELKARRKSDGCPLGVKNQDIEVRLPPGRHFGGLKFSEEDAGMEGCFKVRWIGDEEGTVIDGGINITSSWTLVDEQKNLWSTPAPAELLTPEILPVRTMYVGGVRYNRTRDTPGALAMLGNNNSLITPDGYLVTSTEPQTWTDPTTVEIVKHTAFTSIRCPIASISALSDVSSPPQTATDGTCAWGQKLMGRSPGSTIGGVFNITTWEACQAECCKRENASTPCTGIMYKPPPTSLCYLVNRDVLPNFGPSGNNFVANMNPPPVTYRTAINISQPCLLTARGYKYGQGGYPDYLENTGSFTGLGQFYLDRKKGIILATFLPPHTPPAGGGQVEAVMGLQEVLLDVHDTHDVEWHNVSFQHSAWTQINSGGYVERFSNLYITEQGILDPAAAVVVERSHRVLFDGCAFERLGAFGIRIQNGSQDVGVTYCTFNDISGGAVMLGSPQENVAAPEDQLARITISDNSMTHLSVEYVGAAAIHSMVVANSTFEHNLIRDIGYCGISWNWPAKQGPTFPFPCTDPDLGYNANNIVANNDVSYIMRDTSDGGGIHSVGCTTNTTYSGNYFHDIQAAAVSIIYIDNNAAGFQINDNVVDNCPNSAMGPYYFQSIPSAQAHDNYVNGLYTRNAGNVSARGLPCNCSGPIVDVPAGQPFPAEAAAIISSAGPRPR